MFETGLAGTLPVVLQAPELLLAFLLSVFLWVLSKVVTISEDDRNTDTTEGDLEIEDQPLSEERSTLDRSVEVYRGYPNADRFPSVTVGPPDSEENTSPEPGRQEADKGRTAAETEGANGT